ncbi:MAG: hypothetical protein NTY41_13720 [Proteobacteria bacterium]|nr:hypothetical protein [Pseudomonadota bacterium]
MNFYVVVEGEVGEKLVYKEWIPYVAPHLSFAPTIRGVTTDNYFIVSGGGYPNLFEIIEDGIDDVISLRQGGVPLFDRLVVVVDSEDFSREDRLTEINSAISHGLSARAATIDYKIIIQHFCLEAWALGNKKIVSKNVRDPSLKMFLETHNVFSQDPELLPAFPARGLNRAQAATVYLRLLLNNKFRRLTYTKNNPDALLNQKYFDQLRIRQSSSGHIDSFSTFIEAFD